MDEETKAAVSDALRAVAGGKAQASEELVSVLYSELRKLAHGLMRNEPPGHTLQPTALVHEAYLRLIGSRDPGWDGRGHFFGSAARAMRRILVDRARRKAAVKHGGERMRIDLHEVDLAIESPPTDVIALDEALTRLEAADPRAAEVVNLRYFAGLSADETAAAMGVSVSTVEREWRFARTLLRSQLAAPESQ